jgi:DNA replication and repair protein RecF
VFLTELKIESVRNLQAVSLASLQKVNVFYGSNGSGKTSVLEAVHLLGMARSFRDVRVKTVISHGQHDCTVFGKIRQRPDVSLVPVGVQRSRDGDVSIRAGQNSVHSVAELVEYLPLQVICADSFSLLGGAPGVRRKFLDWGVFHVELGFYDEWQKFRRCLKQRNKLIRSGNVAAAELSVWTRDLAHSGVAITKKRSDYYEKLAEAFRCTMTLLSPELDGLELRLIAGWDRTRTYLEVLEASTSSDLERGYTQAGPQRADLRILERGRVASEVLSRGQQKLVVCGLKIAQGRVMSEVRGVPCVYLVDDLPSELDVEHSRRVCRLLEELQAQVFLTCIDREQIASVWPERSMLKTFHVEQGAVTPDNDCDD